MASVLGDSEGESGDRWDIRARWEEAEGALGGGGGKKESTR